MFKLVLKGDEKLGEMIHTLVPAVGDDRVPDESIVIEHDEEGNHVLSHSLLAPLAMILALASDTFGTDSGHVDSFQQWQFFDGEGNQL